jgi:hypothetical protein
MKIIYFPYLTMGSTDELKFGDVTVWNFTRKGSEYIPDAVKRAKVKALLGMNKRHNEEIENIGILAINGESIFDSSFDISTSPADPSAEATETRLLLFLAGMWRHGTVGRGQNSGSHYLTSENFQFVIQNFSFENEDTAEVGGFIVRSVVGGYKISETTYSAPVFVLDPSTIFWDDVLIDYLLQTKQQNIKLYQRILRAADAMFESWFNDPTVSHNSRILAQARAFEILLELPESAPRKEFKSKIKKLCVEINDPDPIVQYLSDRGTRPKETETESIKVKWADRFYALRNKIIHGDSLEPDDYQFESKHPHFLIGMLFFLLSMKKLLNTEFTTRIFHDHILWNAGSESDDSYAGFVYESGVFERSHALHRHALHRHALHRQVHQQHYDDIENELNAQNS